MVKSESQHTWSHCFPAVHVIGKNSMQKYNGIRQWSRQNFKELQIVVLACRRVSERNPCPHANEGGWKTKNNLRVSAHALYKNVFG